MALGEWDVEVQSEKRQEQEEDARRLPPREYGDDFSDETRLLRACAEAQAQAIRGMQQTRVIGEELLQAKADVARLQAEAVIKDEAHRSKEALLHAIIRSKDELLLSKTEQLHSKDAVPHANGYARDAAHSLSHLSVTDVALIVRLGWFSLTIISDCTGRCRARAQRLKRTPPPSRAAASAATSSTCSTRTTSRS